MGNKQRLNTGRFSIDEVRIRGIVSAALSEGRSSLTELEGMDVLDAMGLGTPIRAFTLGSADAGPDPIAAGSLPTPSERAITSTPARVARATSCHL